VGHSTARRWAAGVWPLERIGGGYPPVHTGTPGHPIGYPFPDCDLTRTIPSYDPGVTLMRPGAASAPLGGALVLSLAPYRESHRAGKVARSYAKRLPTTYLALQAAGRSGVPGAAGVFSIDGIRVLHMPAKPAIDTARALTPWVNLVRTYLPALARLARTTLSTPAAVVQANGTALLPLAVLHRWRFGSVVVLDVDEKPGSASQPRSVGVLFRPLEPLVLRSLTRFVDTVVTVTARHRDLLMRDYRFGRHLVVRNAPEGVRRGDFVSPARVGQGDPVVFVAVSSIFEGRCFEALIDACGLLQAQGARVEVRVFGYARPAYFAALTDRVPRAGADELIRFRGQIAAWEVAGAYAQCHVGLSLYQPEFDHNDSLPNKVLEAVSCGRPVLATGQRDVEELLESAGTGWVTGSSAEAIAASMLELEREIRSGAIDLAAMARRCRALGDGELNWEHEFEPMLDLVAPRRAAPAQVAADPA
jgi:glycosyltransferase involved in cell wall biosynthesis